ncbi:hypothetical protein [Brucella sp.]|uniref:hypothetical protein n=1 Tax=Brucella sp. TaxID=52132 RepID=UPI0028A5D81E|nr:hypothetical protein [Brucella sp.]
MLMPIHRELIHAAKKTKSLKNVHLTEAGRAIGLGLVEIHAAEHNAADKFDELLRKLDEVEKKEK